MDLKIAGRVIEVLDEQSGESRNGPWRKRDFILETEDDYPRKVCITQWGDDIEKFGVGEGDQLTAHIDIQSREYNGRWYTDVKAWKIARADPRTGDAPSDARTGDAPSDARTVDRRDAAEPDDDLPF